jgi:hypothetical protein
MLVKGTLEDQLIELSDEQRHQLLPSRHIEDHCQSLSAGTFSKLGNLSGWTSSKHRFGLTDLGDYLSPCLHQCQTAFQVRNTVTACEEAETGWVTFQWNFVAIGLTWRQAYWRFGQVIDMESTLASKHGIFSLKAESLQTKRVLAGWHCKRNSFKRSHLRVD